MKIKEAHEEERVPRVRRKRRAWGHQQQLWQQALHPQMHGGDGARLSIAIGRAAAWVCRCGVHISKCNGCSERVRDKERHVEVECTTHAVWLRDTSGHVSPCLCSWAVVQACGKHGRMCCMHGDGTCVRGCVLGVAVCLACIHACRFDAVCGAWDQMGPDGTPTVGLRHLFSRILC